MIKLRYCSLLLLGAALQSGLLGNLASAADLPEIPSLKDAPPSFTALWQGFYIGGNLGGEWGGAGVSDSFVYVGDPAFNGSSGGTGFTGGAQAGYNVQRGRFVFGFEGDIGYLNLQASKPVSFHPGSCSATYASGPENYTGRICDIDAIYSSSSGLYGDLTARLGYTLGRTLLYAKGGAAFLNADFNANYSGQNCKTLGICGTGGPSAFHFGQDGTLAGWTIGAGAEYALNRSWSLKAEYRHFDFGSLSYSYSGCVSLGGVCSGSPSVAGHFTSTINGRTDVSLTADAVTVGVNYRLGD